MTAPVPFTSSPDSLDTYEAPEWFRDAKFGIWAHWGPQAVPRQGDWYARFMYVPGHHHYDHHLKTYGHPSEFGYKDILPLWTAEKWDPEALMDRYVAAGAKYFFSMGVHHDNFELWKSKSHRWNATLVGPKRDVVGEWRKAAKARGLKFGVSEHLGASYTWFTTSHGFDQFWPKMGVPYDGANPLFSDLYHPPHDEHFRDTAETWYARDPAWQRQWFERISHMLESYTPDLVYTDGCVPFGAVGRTLIADYFNASIAANGQCEAVYFCKNHMGKEVYGVLDIERGVASGIAPEPWQTDTSLGDWFYRDDDTYKATGDVIHMLADVVSKNGNLLLNVTMLADGSLPPEADTFLTEMAEWIGINGEAIYDTRPWKIHGEGPTEAPTGSFKESATYSPRDIRFTTKDGALFAITLGEPESGVSIAALGNAASHEPRPVTSVHLLGAGDVAFRRTDAALEITLPERLPTRHASAFRIAFD